MTVTKRRPTRFTDMHPLITTASGRLAGRLLSLAACAWILTACGSAPVAQSSASPLSSAAPVAQSSASPLSSAAALSCVTSGPASAAWPQPWTRTTTAPPIRTVTLAGDTLTISFDGGTPPFVVAPQTSPRFYHEPGLIDLAGSAGVHIALSGFRGDMVNYDGPRSIASSGPLALQAYNLEDFEGYVGWGVGTSGPACANVTASRSTLTFRFIPTPASG